MRYGYLRKSQTVSNFPLHRHKSLNAGGVSFFEAGLGNIQKGGVFGTGNCVVLVESGVHHPANFFWESVCHNRDNADGTDSYQGNGNGIIAGNHHKVIGFMRYHPHNLIHITGCLLDGNNIGAIGGNANGGISFDIAAGTRGHII